MTQPRFAPIEVRDEVRPAKHLGTPYPWRAHRPGEHVPGQGEGRARAGTAGPDQGYALLLAEKVRDRLVLAEGEHVDDALAVVVQVALRRAARFGRAPVMGDLDVALGLLSYGASVSEQTAVARRAAVLGASHDEWRRRELAQLVPDDLLAVASSGAGVGAIDWNAPVL